MEPKPLQWDSSIGILSANFTGTRHMPHLQSGGILLFWLNENDKVTIR